VQALDRGSSVAGGFSIIDRGGVIRVSRPVVTPLKGLIPERQALMVRVTRSGYGAI